MRLGLNKRPQTGAFVYLLGGHPDEVHEKYELFSPLYHVQPGCPATLLIHGQGDFLVPAEATVALARKLRVADVPVILVVLPETDHAFDLVLPRWSPPAQSALYEIERFLAFMAV
jgi:acetyl esterase/lipase